MWTPSDLASYYLGQGIPVNPNDMSMGSQTDKTSWYIGLEPGSTAQDQINLDNAIQATDVHSHLRHRYFYEVYSDIQKLTTAQWTNVWKDLGATSPRKYWYDRGPMLSGIIALDWSWYTSGAAAAQQKIAQMEITALYVVDNPLYLVEPTFDTTILVSGWTSEPD